MKEKLADQVFNHFSMTDTLLQQKVSLSAPPTVAACPLFLPILQLRLSYKGKIYEVLVNGQSGEVSGERPFSAPKILGIMAIVLTGLLLALLLRNKTKSNFWAQLTLEIMYSKNLICISKADVNFNVIRTFSNLFLARVENCARGMSDTLFFFFVFFFFPSPSNSWHTCHSGVLFLLFLEGPGTALSHRLDGSSTSTCGAPVEDSFKFSPASCWVPMLLFKEEHELLLITMGIYSYKINVSKSLW